MFLDITLLIIALLYINTLLGNVYIHQSACKNSKPQGLEDDFRHVDIYIYIITTTVMIMIHVICIICIYIYIYMYTHRHIYIYIYVFEKRPYESETLKRPSAPCFSNIGAMQTVVYFNVELRNNQICKELASVCLDI